MASDGYIDPCDTVLMPLRAFGLFGLRKKARPTAPIYQVLMPLRAFGLFGPVLGTPQS